MKELPFQSLCCLVVPLYDYIPDGLCMCRRFFVTWRYDLYTFEGRTS